MAKGTFTQGICLLTDAPVEIEAIRASLQTDGFEIVKQTEADENVFFGGTTLLISYMPKINGYAAVDIVNKPWPDSMGDTKSDYMTLGAWSMGYFGPLTYPYGLKRACEHSWVWEKGKTIPLNHRGFIRIRLSYSFGAKGSDPVFPKGCDPRRELFFVSRIANILLSLPNVICYFNPNGEVLRDREGFSKIWNECLKEENIPLPLWSNIRFFSLNETFCLMDTVGNGQLDLMDVEAIYPKAAYPPGDIDYYLRNVTHYLLEMNGEFHTGESIDGPGETNLSWTVEVLEEGLIEPPRKVLRIYPKANSKVIRDVLSTVRR